MNFLGEWNTEASKIWAKEGVHNPSARTSSTPEAKAQKRKHRSNDNNSLIKTQVDDWFNAKMYIF